MREKKPLPITGDIAVGDVVCLKSSDLKGTVVDIEGPDLDRLKVCFLTSRGAFFVSAVEHCFTFDSIAIPNFSRKERILSVLELDSLSMREIAARTELQFKNASSVLSQMVSEGSIVNNKGIYSRVNK